MLQKLPTPLIATFKLAGKDMFSRIYGYFYSWNRPFLFCLFVSPCYPWFLSHLMRSLHLMSERIRWSVTIGHCHRRRYWQSTHTAKEHEAISLGVWYIQKASKMGKNILPSIFVSQKSVTAPIFTFCMYASSPVRSKRTDGSFSSLGLSADKSWVEVWHQR